jgi:hypothetical protein
MTCLVDALVADTMLRRRRYPSKLCLGVRSHAPSKALVGHAWVEGDGEIVVGQTGDLGTYAPLTPRGSDL